MWIGYPERCFRKSTLNGLPTVNGIRKLAQTFKEKEIQPGTVQAYQ